MLLPNIVNCLCDDGRFSFATCFRRVQVGSKSVPNLHSAHLLKSAITRQNINMYIYVCVCLLCVRQYTLTHTHTSLFFAYFVLGYEYL